MSRADLAPRARAVTARERRRCRPRPAPSALDDRVEQRLHRARFASIHAARSTASGGGSAVAASGRCSATTRSLGVALASAREVAGAVAVGRDAGDRPGDARGELQSITRS